MDKGTQKEEVRSLYLTAEMAAWGDNQTKEKNQMDWLKGRVKEISTWSGASLIALGLLIVLGGPFVNILAWAAIVWGIISVVKKQG
tara:strand:- start:338 stop:595 length:258 start_codon:yes stop_codon:yes gene_type:complete